MNDGDDRSESRTSTTLIRRAQQADPAAWHELVQLYGRRIYRWCRRSGLQSADAGNVMQEVLRSLARKLPDFRHDRREDSFRGWVRRITMNKVHDHFRRSGRDVARPRGGTDAHRLLQLVPGEDDESEPTWGAQYRTSLEPLRVGMSEWVRQVRDTFSERDWQVFWRVVVDGQSAREAGEEFAMTPNAVRLVKMRLLRALRTRWSEHLARDQAE